MNSTASWLIVSCVMY